MLFDDIRYRTATFFNKVTRMDPYEVGSGVGLSNFSVSDLQLKRLRHEKPAPLRYKDALTILQNQAMLITQGQKKGSPAAPLALVVSPQTVLFGNQPALSIYEPTGITITNDDGYMRAWHNNGDFYRSAKHIDKKGSEMAVALVKQSVEMVKKKFDGQLPDIDPKTLAILDPVSGKVIKPGIQPS